MALVLQDVIAASEAFVNLAREAEKCIELHRKARLPLPPMLEAFANDIATAKPKAAPRLHLFQPVLPANAPPRPKMPSKAGEGWISIPIKLTGPSSAAKALLREHGPLLSQDLHGMVMSFIGGSTFASFWGILQRLAAEGYISYKDELVTPLRPSTGGIISDGYLWSLPEELTSQERAAYRRETLLLAVEQQPGLGVVELTKALSEAKFEGIVVNKDAIKADLNELRRAEKITRRADKKWEVVKGLN